MLGLFMRSKAPACLYKNNRIHSGRIPEPSQSVINLPRVKVLAKMHIRLKFSIMKKHPTFLKKTKIKFLRGSLSKTCNSRWSDDQQYYVFLIETQG